MAEFLQATIAGIGMSAVYALGALGFALIFKCSHVFNLSHGMMMMAGGFFALTFNVALGWPLWLSLIAALILGAIMGWGLQYIFIRPLLGQPLITTLMVTIAMLLIVKGLVLAGWRYRSYIPTGSIIPIETLRIGETTFSADYLSAIMIALIAFAGIIVFFRFTKQGITLRANAEDEQLAESMGVRVRAVTGFAWMLAGMAAVLGGLALGSINSINYMSGEIAIKVLPVVVIGGLESIPGCIVGGLLLGLSEMYTGTYLEEFLVGFKDVMPYIIMTLMLLIKPYGIFGEVRIERV